MTKQDIGNRVRQSRQAQGFTQKELAAKAGLSRYQHIIEIENAQYNYGIDTLLKVLEALDITLCDDAEYGDFNFKNIPSINKFIL